MSDRPWRDLTGGVSPDGTQRTVESEYRVDLTAGLSSARQARAAVRETLAAWGLENLSGDTELLASELVTNAAQYGDGNPISLVLRRQAGLSGEPGVMCEVTDGSPTLPYARDTGPESERGRGLAIVAALASTSGVTVRPAGKTAWFTLTPADLTQRQPAAEAEAEIGG